MQLVLVRHADAGDKEEWAESGKPDDERPLSPKGKRQMKAAVAGLVTLVEGCDLLVTSPLVRAEQTARIVATAYEGVEAEETDTLKPDTHPEAFEAWLRRRQGGDVVIAVGHEPHLGELATWMMTGQIQSRIQFKKGGAALLEVGKDFKHGEATLRWLMGPKDLAALA